ncbi:MAG: tetratricopeptide repeat protein, partial [Planctomycetota bacterium]
MAPLLAAVILVLAGCPQSQPEAADVTANNRGVGLMGKYEYDEARQIFEGLAAAHPDWLDVRVNLAIATLNRQQEGDEQRALDILTAVLEADPDHWRAQYCSGVLKFYRGRQDEAQEHLRLVAEADPADAYAAYYVGQCVEPQDRDEALRWYQRAVACDPYLRSAYYRQFQLLLRLGRTDEAYRVQADW